MASIASLADTEYCYLTTTGRRSGEPHRMEIWFVAHDDGAFLLSDTGRSDWYRNLEARPEVSLEIGGERRDTMARPVSADDAANAVVRAAMVAKYQPGYEEDLAEWSVRAFLVRIEWPAEP